MCRFSLQRGPQVIISEMQKCETSWEEPAKGLAPLIAIVGPTAVGKTRFSLELAERFGGEIVSADSRQIYIFMDIGTAKPSASQRARVPHHLIDIVYPDEVFTLAQYQARAYQAIEDITRRGRVPFLVGGTGLYVRAVLEGFAIPSVPPDPKLRRQLERKAAEEGGAALHARLARLDPQAAAAIDSRNVRRVIRALEVHKATGIPISQLQTHSPPPYRILKIGLTIPRERLYELIDQRVEKMLAQGLVEEVRGFLARGYGPELPAMSGLGYRQIGLYLAGEMDLESAAEMIKRETRRFARQQYTWFSLDDANIHWFSGDDEPLEEMAALAYAFLSRRRE